MSDLVSELVKWTESGYVDRGVWTQISSNINTTALPTNLEALQLPPVPEPQPTQLAFMVSIIIARKRICGKAMFLHLSVILFTGIGYLYRGNGFCPGGSLSGGVSVGEDPPLLYDKERVDAFYWNAFSLFVSLPEGGPGETYQTDKKNRTKNRL